MHRLPVGLPEYSSITPHLLSYELSLPQWLKHVSIYTLPAYRPCKTSTLCRQGHLRKYYRSLYLPENTASGG